MEDFRLGIIGKNTLRRIFTINKTMKKILLFFITLLFAGTITAQKNIVEGIIQDADGKPVKNSSISIQDTRIKTKTNKNGQFKLKDVRSDDSLLIMVDKKRYVTFVAGNNKKLTITIKDDILNIEQENGVILSCPLREMLHEHNGRRGSVITAKMIERNGYLSLRDAIKANIPGVHVTDNSISIRESRTLNLSTAPLVVLDGTETTFETAESMCDIRDVETIEVDKDGLGYGVKGANGVIIIKTKK